MNIDTLLLDEAGHTLERTAYILNRTSQIQKPLDVGDPAATFPDRLTPQQKANGITWALTQIDEAESTLQHVRESFETELETLPSPTFKPITPRDIGRKVQLIVRDGMGHDTGLRQEVGFLICYKRNRAAVQIEINGRIKSVPYNVCDLEPVEGED